jgi:hypothetical protein
MCTIIDLQAERRKRYPSRVVSIEITAAELRAMHTPGGMTALAILLDDEAASPPMILDRLRFAQCEPDVITVTLDNRAR